MAKGMMGAEEMEQKRAELLKYCRLDTLAMVRLHEKLFELMNGQRFANKCDKPKPRTNIF